MELLSVNGYIAIDGLERIKFMNLLWNKNNFRDGYINIGMPYQSSNSEILTEAYKMTLLLDNSTAIYNKLSSIDFIERELINFYKNGGVITFNTKNVVHAKEFSDLLNDEMIEKILYCLFIINISDNPSLFYLDYFKEYTKYFVHDDLVIRELKNIFNFFIEDAKYIIKIIPLKKELISKIDDIQETLIWDIYQECRSIMVTDKISLAEGEIKFRQEYFGNYIIYDYGSTSFIKPDMKEIATGYALAIIFSKMGNSVAFYKSKINNGKKFMNLVFIVAARLLILNMIMYIHGDLHIGNFVYDTTDKPRREFIQFEDLLIHNELAINSIFDLIDFGSCINFRDNEGIKQFVAKTIPNIYNNNKQIIDRLVKSSIVDISTIMSLLDLYVFINNIYNSSELRIHFEKEKMLIEEYIIEEINNYLTRNDYNFNEEFTGGSEVEFIGGLMDKIDKSTAFYEEENDNWLEEGFKGGLESLEKNNINFLTVRQMPLYKLLKKFYRNESDNIDSSRVISPIE